MDGKAVITWGGYGGLLLVSSFFAAGLGHGTYVPMGIAASPISAVPNVCAALVAIPILWSVVGVLASSSNHRLQRYAFRAVLLLHYAALPLVLSDHEHFGDTSYVRRDPGTFGFFVVIYVIGQVALWTVHAKACLRPAPLVDPCLSCGYDRRGLPANSRCPECGNESNRGK
jgi:hypothetical protein